MQILAKLKLDIDRVRVKTSIGCDVIEYQRLPLDSDESQELISDGYLAVIGEQPVRAMHLPMSNCNVNYPGMNSRACRKGLLYAMTF